MSRRSCRDDTIEECFSSSYRYTITAIATVTAGIAIAACLQQSRSRHRCIVVISQIPTLILYYPPFSVPIIIYTGIVVAATCNCAVTTSSLNCQQFQLNESIVNVTILSRGVCDFEMYSTTDYPPTQT